MVDEMIGQIRSVTSGVALDADSLALEAIAECAGPGMGYVASIHTAAFMKRDVYYSDFCGRIESSYQESYEKAHEKVKEIFARRDTDAHVAVEARLKEDETAWREGADDWWAFYIQDL